MLSQQHTLLILLPGFGEGAANFGDLFTAISSCTSGSVATGMCSGVASATFTGVFRLLRDDELLDWREPAAAFEADFGV